MSERSELLWSLAMLVIVGFLWAIWAPNCLGKSFAYPAIFGAGIIGYLSGRRGGLGEDDGGNTFTLLVMNWARGWLAVVFAVPAVGLGWFLGAVACFNLLPIDVSSCFVCLDR